MLIRARRQRGITLIELVITIVVLAIALAAITLTLSEGISRSSDTLLELRAVALAQAYLDEAVGKRFDENSANTGVPPCRAPGTLGVPLDGVCTASGALGAEEAERQRYDDVDDYDDINEGAGVAFPNDTLKDAQGNDRVGYDGFTVSIDVRYIDVGGTELGLGLGQINVLNDQYDAKVIEVTVSHTALPSDYVFTAYKSNF